MDRKIYLLVAFDGTDFHGWQHQPGFRTVQQTLEAAARRVVRHPITMVGCGRTDSGVHAAGHVSHFVTSCSLTPWKFRHALASRLPKDLSIIDLREVDPRFNARGSALSKLYRYRIFAARGRPVEQDLQRSTYHFWRPLDLGRMRAASKHFVGEHDFSSMAASGCKRESMVRRVLRCEVYPSGDEIRIDVEGTGFLYKQVRNMVGSLVDVGRGHREPQWVQEILAGRDRTAAGGTAPGCGLCLRWVRYPANLLHAPESAGQTPQDRTGVDGSC